MTLLLKKKLDDETEGLATAVIGAAIEVHRELGPGYMEKVYENALSVELGIRGIDHALQVPISVMYKNVKVQGQILDMVVDKKIILELKVVSELVKAHESQILSYLKSTRMQLGLLINFNESLLKNGIKRFIST